MLRMERTKMNKNIMEIVLINIQSQYQVVVVIKVTNNAVKVNSRLTNSVVSFFNCVLNIFVVLVTLVH